MLVSFSSRWGGNVLWTLCVCGSLETSISALQAAFSFECFRSLRLILVGFDVTHSCKTQSVEIFYCRISHQAATGFALEVEVKRSHEIWAEKCRIDDRKDCWCKVLENDLLTVAFSISHLVVSQTSFTLTMYKRAASVAHKMDKIWSLQQIASVFQK